MNESLEHYIECSMIDIQKYLLFDFIYVKWVKKQIESIITEGAWGWARKPSWLGSGTEEIWGDDRDVLYLDCGGGYVDVFMCQKSYILPQISFNANYTS